jgi:hypothetical protein
LEGGVLLSVWQIPEANPQVRSSDEPQQPSARSGYGRRRNQYNDPRNPLIKFYNLETGVLDQCHIARAYGNQDMYRDLNASDANHIEKQLGILEQDASRVVRHIKEAQTSGATGVDLTRIQLNNLRKFLFVMKYRNNLFWKKYNRTMKEYTSVDKSEVQAFMKRHGFTKPAEVWLHNLKFILDTHIDVREEWKQVVLQNVFSHDAQWYILHMTGAYLCFCQPIHPDDEFIIAENSFGIHEGPTIPGGSYTEYHRVAPLAPQLLLVLRSNLFRDGNEQLLRAYRARPEVSDSPSMFEALQLHPATPTYGVQDMESFEARDDHVFSFKIQKISTDYTNIFNAVMLEEARESITWFSDKAMQKALKAYLANPKFLPDATTFMENKRLAKVRLLGILDGLAPEQFPLSPEGVVEKVEDELSNKPELEVYFKLGRARYTHSSSSAYVL